MSEVVGKTLRGTDFDSVMQVKNIDYVSKANLMTWHYKNCSRQWQPVVMHLVQRQGKERQTFRKYQAFHTIPLHRLKACQRVPRGVQWVFHT